MPTPLDYGVTNVPVIGLFARLVDALPNRGVYAYTADTSRTYATAGATGLEALTRLNPASVSSLESSAVQDLLTGRPIGATPPPLPATGQPSPATGAGSGPPASPGPGPALPGSTTDQTLPSIPGVPSASQPPFNPDDLLAQVNPVVPYSVTSNILRQIGVGVRRLPVGAVASGAAQNTGILGDVATGENLPYEVNVFRDLESEIPPWATNTPGVTGPDARSIYISLLRSQEMQRQIERELAQQEFLKTYQGDLARQAARAEAAVRSVDEALRVTVTRGQQPTRLRRMAQRLRGFFTPLRLAGLAGAAILPRLGRGPGTRTISSLTDGIDPLTQPPLEDRVRGDQGLDSLARALASRNTPQNRYCEDQRRKKRSKRRRCKQRANVAWTSGPRKGHIAGTKCLEFE